MEKVKLQMGNIGFVKLSKTKTLAYYGWYRLSAFVNEMLLEVRIRNGIGNMHERDSSIDALQFWFF
jgi:hypothetical protein